MKIIFDVDIANNYAKIINVDVPASIWNEFNSYFSPYLTNIEYDFNENYFCLPWRVFISLKKDFRTYSNYFGFEREYTNSFRECLEISRKKSYSTVFQAQHLSKNEICDILKSKGFERELTNNQKDNLSKIGLLVSGATFSVPGAGKTTEALAFFFLNANANDKLLVVAPKNAFAAWEEQLQKCMPTINDTFVRLTRGEENISSLLRLNNRFYLITYQQFYRVKLIINDFLRLNSVFMFLDESHRIKSGKSGIAADAILDAAFLPKRKLIMSGTPMPQSVNDLIPQFYFLYPDVHITSENIINLIDPIYVRTTKLELGIPPINYVKHIVKMGSLQRKVYDSIKYETKRQFLNLNDYSKAALRKLGKSIIKIIEFVSNPSLLASDINYVFNNDMANLLMETDGPKIEYVCRKARELASDGKKVIIWSSFVQNVELISMRLRDIGSDYIHGGVDAGSEDDEDTREGKIKRFHDDPNMHVLVANPAACSEGISLHKVCQYAIYIDRSFNAAHFLQSEDRIHRLGLLSTDKPTVEIVECENSIDQLIDSRLIEKVNKMSDVLNDKSIRIESYGVEFEDDSDEISNDDIEAIRSFFLGD